MTEFLRGVAAGAVFTTAIWFWIGSHVVGIVANAAIEGHERRQAARP